MSGMYSVSIATTANVHSQINAFPVKESCFVRMIFTGATGQNALDVV